MSPSKVCLVASCVEVSKQKELRAAARGVMRASSASEKIANLTAVINRLDIARYNADVMTPPVGSKTAQRRRCQKPLSGLSGFYRPLITLAQGLMESISTAVNTRTKTRPFTTYGQSKLGDVLCASEYANLVSDKGILSLSLNPGNLKSNLQRHYGFIVRQVMGRTFLYPPRLGGLTELYAGFAPEPAANKGFTYIIPWGRIGILNKGGKIGLEGRQEVMGNFGRGD
ncbi:hypothetical protein V1523DRAFT_450775 [Lipomyces doorenjongii]